MTIIEALKEGDLRLDSNSNRKWMYWENDVWVVRIQEYRKHTSQIIIETEDEEEAIKHLIED